MSPACTAFSNPVPTFGSMTAPLGPSGIMMPVGVVNEVHGFVSPDTQVPPAPVAVPPPSTPLSVLAVGGGGELPFELLPQLATPPTRASAMQTATLSERV